MNTDLTMTQEQETEQELQEGLGQGLETEVQQETFENINPQEEPKQHPYSHLSGQEKVDYVIKEQELRTPNSVIADNLGTTAAGLRAFMNRQGFKSDNGIFKPKDFKKDSMVQGTLEIEDVKACCKKSKKDPTKYVQITAETYDMLSTVYDWFLQVKDNKKLFPKTTKKNRELCIYDDYSDEELVHLKVSIPESVARDFEIFCGNSKHNSSDIYTQALVSFMEEHKALK